MRTDSACRHETRDTGRGTRGKAPRGFTLCLPSRLWRLVATAAVTLVVGCGVGSPRPVAVRGQVTYQGRPLGKGTVTFIPTEPGPPATGQIQPDGKFTLSTFRPGDGALPGRYAVMVIAVGDTAGRLPDDSNPPASLLVPRKYASYRTSEITAEVKETNDPIPIDLK